MPSSRLARIDTAAGRRRRSLPFAAALAVIAVGCTDTTDAESMASSGSAGDTAPTVVAPTPSDLAVDTTTSEPESTSTLASTTTTPPSTSTTPETTTSTTTTTPPPPPPETTTSTTTTSTTTTTTTTTEPPLEDLVIPLVLGEAAVTESLTDDDDGSTSSSPDAVSVRISTVGVDETDAADVIATWTIPSAVFADYGPQPQVSVYFDTAVSAALETDNWSGNAASLFITADGRLGDSDVGRAESVLAQIGRGAQATLIAEEHIAGFGSPVDLAGGPGALVIEFRVSCFVASSDNLFGFGAESSCDVSAVQLQEARVTIRPTSDA